MGSEVCSQILTPTQQTLYWLNHFSSPTLLSKCPVSTEVVNRIYSEFVCSWTLWGACVAIARSSYWAQSPI